MISASAVIPDFFSFPLFSLRGFKSSFLSQESLDEKLKQDHQEVLEAEKNGRNLISKFSFSRNIIASGSEREESKKAFFDLEFTPKKKLLVVFKSGPASRNFEFNFNSGEYKAILDDKSLKKFKTAAEAMAWIIEDIKNFTVDALHAIKSEPNPNSLDSAILRIRESLKKQDFKAAMQIAREHAEINPADSNNPIIKAFSSGDIRLILKMIIEDLKKDPISTLGVLLDPNKYFSRLSKNLEALKI